ncbi:Fe-only nitrogenase accessory AnfO family protein [Desulfoscipio geothermicus]|uniref:Fe-only nitrogenase accessory protein AnfO n=1 Tax=Desulfoscipio geothermicus DSM 3669 TaxID=1121426 RepID=A0A1I6ECP6_9FIRM|nr:Fe-only nitrogenase accessory AnfO family protein [Desulfoscipio geothermicus]SFR15520.1 Fe-only nitrogenase accessory protein AnfO [Desulfoscipio geothermicus DSM 3669]
MAFDIAVYIDENGETTSLNDPGKLVVHRKRQGRWKVCREKEFRPVPAEGMSGLRRLMGEVLEFMGGCRVFVGNTVTGIPYFELEKSNCAVWEMQGKPRDFLDYILTREEEEHRREEKSAVVVVPVPEETGAGCYRISIKEIQENNIGVTSKQVLLPFLRQGNFYELKVLCNHIPPWLEAEFLTGKLCGEVNNIGSGELEIIITKSCCKSR